jgi:starch synthase
LYNRPGIYTSGADEHLRFILLSRAAIEMCQHMGFAPDIFHCHDWHTALIPMYLKTYYDWDRLFANTRSVLTIHNIGYQGVFGAGILPDMGMADRSDKLHQEDLALQRVNFLKTGVLCRRAHREPVMRAKSLLSNMAWACRTRCSSGVNPWQES